MGCSSTSLLRPPAPSDANGVVHLSSRFPLPLPSAPDPFDDHRAWPCRTLARCLHCHRDHLVRLRFSERCAYAACSESDPLSLARRKRERDREAYRPAACCTDAGCPVGVPTRSASAPHLESSTSDPASPSPPPPSDSSGSVAMEPRLHFKADRCKCASVTGTGGHACSHVDTGRLSPRIYVFAR